MRVRNDPLIAAQLKTNRLFLVSCWIIKTTRYRHRLLPSSGARDHGGGEIQTRNGETRNPLGGRTQAGRWRSGVEVLTMTRQALCYRSQRVVIARDPVCYGGGPHQRELAV